MADPLKSDAPKCRNVMSIKSVDPVPEELGMLRHKFACAKCKHKASFEFLEQP
jgi:hypothetical protein